MKVLIIFWLTVWSIGIPVSYAQQIFKDVTDSFGIRHIHEAQNYMGGGVVFLDFDNDGFEDIFLTGGSASNKLYRNINGEFFQDVTVISGIAGITGSKTKAAVAGDIDNDGWKELFIATESGHNMLLKNEGGSFFKDISTEAGIIHESFSMGASFADFNQDGLLDIYVINFVKEQRFIRNDNNEVIGFDHDCYPNLLYINNGNNTFTESAQAYGVADEGCGLAVVADDIDDDGDVDIYIANDFGEWVRPNVCLRNNYPDPTFTDVSDVLGMGLAMYGMGIAAGDLENDAKKDYYVSNLGSNALLNQTDAGVFTDIAPAALVENDVVGGAFSTSWGTVFTDYDNDGFQDLVVSNGFVPSPAFIQTSSDDPNKLFRNNADGTFTDISQQLPQADSVISRGLAKADIDNDGRQDLLFANLSTSVIDLQNVYLYKNQFEAPGNWFALLLEGTEVNRDAIGTKVILESGGKSYTQSVLGGSSHASQNSLRLHFGLGTLDKIDKMTIRWSDGSSEVLNSGFMLNRTMYYLQGSGELLIAGCMNPQAINFSDNAQYNHGCKEDVYGCTDPDADNFDPAALIEDGSCFITDIDGVHNKGISIYPNPVSDVLNLVSEEQIVSFKIMDINGVSIIHLMYPAGQIRTDHLPRGFYVLSVQTRTSLMYHRIYKE